LSREREKRKRERKKKEEREKEKKRKIRPFFAFHQKIFELSAWQKSKKRRGEPHTNNTKEEEEFVKEEEEFIHQRLQRR
jgi:hypothetical protein